MVNNETQLSQVFGALADTTRRGMLAQLSRGPATIGELGAPYEMSKAAVTKHIKVLERAGLLRRDVQGRAHHCAMEPDSLALAQRWVAQVTEFWEARFDTLSDYLDELQEKERRNAGRGPAAKSPAVKGKGRRKDKGGSR